MNLKYCLAGAVAVLATCCGAALAADGPQDSNYYVKAGVEYRWSAMPKLNSMAISEDGGVTSSYDYARDFQTNNRLNGVGAAPSFTVGRALGNRGRWGRNARLELSATGTNFSTRVDRNVQLGLYYLSGGTDYADFLGIDGNGAPAYFLRTGGPLQTSIRAQQTTGEISVAAASDFKLSILHRAVTLTPKAGVVGGVANNHYDIGAYDSSDDESYDLRERLNTNFVAPFGGVSLSLPLPLRFQATVGAEVDLLVALSHLRATQSWDANSQGELSLSRDESSFAPRGELRAELSRQVGPLRLAVNGHANEWWKAPRVVNPQSAAGIDSIYYQFHPTSIGTTNLFSYGVGVNAEYRF